MVIIAQLLFSRCFIRLYFHLYLLIMKLRLQFIGCCSQPLLYFLLIFMFVNFYLATSCIAEGGSVGGLKLNFIGDIVLDALVTLELLWV